MVLFVRYSAVFVTQKKVFVAKKKVFVTKKKVFVMIFFFQFLITHQDIDFNHIQISYLDRETFKPSGLRTVESIFSNFCKLIKYHFYH